MIVQVDYLSPEICALSNRVAYPVRLFDSLFDGHPDCWWLAAMAAISIGGAEGVGRRLVNRRRKRIDSTVYKLVKLLTNSFYFLIYLNRLLVGGLFYV